MTNYAEMTRDELLEEARNRDISGRARMNKDQLVAALEDGNTESGNGSPQTPLEAAGASADEAERLVQEIGEKRSEMANLVQQGGEDERITELQNEIADLEIKRSEINSANEAANAAAREGTPTDTETASEPTEEEGESSAS